MAEWLVYCVSSDIDETLGCVFNQPSGVEESDQPYRDQKSISFQALYGDFTTWLCCLYE